ncbi:hypothetical protein T4D_1862 [Trichinella pseudospiralis]|uniref:Uncharacterized protein n=1 Tax=Trichinella pseudospiralis TaxID=6337 RepID=A0A0V1F8B7_TRIPS|nr:hypothetical protein T4D_1862 [Trichinella pseudospiralis]
MPVGTQWQLLADVNANSDINETIRRKLNCTEIKFELKNYSMLKNRIIFNYFLILQRNVAFFFIVEVTPTLSCLSYRSDG